MNHAAQADRRQAAGEEWVGPSERSFTLKTAGVKSNYSGRTRNAVSVGTFAATPMNAQGWPLT